MVDIVLEDAATKTLFALPNVFNWYCCGPTVHDEVHMGHARTFIIFDTMRRCMMQCGYTVNFGINITDIDDKIMQKIKVQPGKTIDEAYKEFVDDKVAKFWELLSTIRIMPPTVTLRVSEVIPQIVEFIQKLIDSNHAYVSNGSVYFDYDMYHKLYPKCNLSNSTDDDMCVKGDYHSDKKNVKDFALWKAAKPGWVQFSAPWGNGTPGWHIECSVMSNIMFGSDIHLHSGGIDLKYPHHHNEVLQSTAYHDKKDVFKHFIYTGHLGLNGEKMSQSVGNYIKVTDFLKDHSVNTLRLIFLLMKWDQHIDLSESIIIQAKTLEHRIFHFVNEIKYKIKTYIPLKSDELSDNLEALAKFDELWKLIKKDISINFRTIKVLKTFEEWIDYLYSFWKDGKKLDITTLYRLQECINVIINCVGLEFSSIETSDETKWITALLDIRNDIRECAVGKKEDSKTIQTLLFKLTDKIRDIIFPSLGYTVQDTVEGTKVLKS
jgi:cysteinyl-tRNA synthetase